MGIQGKISLHAHENSKLHASTSSLNESIFNELNRTELFHIRVVMKHTKVENLFDLDSQVNLIS